MTYLWNPLNQEEEKIFVPLHVYAFNISHNNNIKKKSTLFNVHWVRRSSASVHQPLSAYRQLDEHHGTEIIEHDQNTTATPLHQTVGDSLQTIIMASTICAPNLFSSRLCFTITSGPQLAMQLIVWLSSFCSPLYIWQGDKKFKTRVVQRMRGNLMRATYPLPLAVIQNVHIIFMKRQ